MDIETVFHDFSRHTIILDHDVKIKVKGQMVQTGECTQLSTLTNTNTTQYQMYYLSAKRFIKYCRGPAKLGLQS